MKHKLTIFAVFLTALTLSAVAQNKQRTDPDHANYSITGNMKVENGQRFLIGAVGKQIDFKFVGRRSAKPTEMADLVVRFDSVTTHPYHPMTKLDFWRYDEEIGEWIYDSEVRQGEQQMESTMKTNIMLVIDNSRSLEGDFKKVQDAAVEFVGQLFRESQGKEIFRVGVIGFSTIKFTKIRDITPLDATNYREIVTFIRSLEMQNGTALYYSLEKALNMLENDTRRNIAGDEYKESRIYAFTDGLDQASVDDSRNLSTPTQYYDHLRPMMQGSTREKINNQIVNSTIVTVRGGDMTDGQERQFDQRAKAICDDVRKLRDMSQLVSEFKKLAEDLVKNNMVLYCYIPVGANGRVGWTFAEDRVVEKKPSKFWMGISVEGGGAYAKREEWGWWYNSYTGQDEWVPMSSYSVFFPFGGISIDAAYPLSSWFALGGSAGFLLSFLDIDPGIELGPLFKFTLNNNSALLMGVGVQYFWGDISDMYPYLELGWKFKSRWYVTAKANVGDGLYSLGVGYSIFSGE